MKQTDIELVQGKTFTDVLRWGKRDQIIYKPITAVGLVAPMRLTVPGHAMVNGWPGAITGVRDIDTDANAVRDRDYHQVTLIDSNTVDINDINAAKFKAYVSGGYLQYHTPQDLTGISARMAIKAKRGVYNLLRCSAITTGVASSTKPTEAGVDGGVTWEATTNVATKEWIAGATYAVDDVIDLETLLFLTVDNGRITIDPALYTITRTIAASTIAGIEWKSAYYDYEAFSSAGEPVVTLLATGKISVVKEVTK